METEANGSSNSSLNDAFQKFLDEPLSTSVSEVSNVSEDAPLEEVVRSTQAVGHGWLKKKETAIDAFSELAPPETTEKIIPKNRDPVVNTNSGVGGAKDIEAHSVSLSVSSLFGKIDKKPDFKESDDYSSTFESEDDGSVKGDSDFTVSSNANSGIAPSEKDEFEQPLFSGEAKKQDEVFVKYSGESSEEKNAEEHTFLEMVFRAEETENEIIRELCIDKEDIPDILQDSSESTDSKKLTFQISQDSPDNKPPQNVNVVAADDLSVQDVSKAVELSTQKTTERSPSITRIPTPIKRTQEAKHTQGRKSVSFAKGVLSTSEHRLENEIEVLRKELNEQEALIDGYQRENEKLYAELKHHKRVEHVAETKWRIEAEKLRMEVGKLREQMNDTENVERRRKKMQIDEEYVAAFKEIKEEADWGQKEVENLRDKVADFQDQIRELSKEKEFLVKEHCHLKDKNRTLEGQLHETERLCARWKFEVDEAKRKKDSPNKLLDKHVICEEKLVATRSRVNVLMKEIEEKDTNTKVTLQQLRQQYLLLKESYCKDLKAREMEKIRLREEMELRVKMLRDELQLTHRGQEKILDSFKTKDKAIQVDSAVGVNLKTKEMNLQLERLELQLEDLKMKYNQLQSEKPSLTYISTRNQNHQAIMKRVCKEERKHSSTLVHLQNKVENLEILSNHLSMLLKESQRRTLLLANENSALKRTVEGLNQELLQTNKDQSEDGSSFIRIEKMIFELQKWQERREMALKEAYFVRNSCNCAIKQRSQINRWQQQVVEKNKEIDAYRRELDALSNCLRQMQENGSI